MDSTQRRVVVQDEPPDASLCERVAAILARGGLVALPTETVYGLGARIDIAEGPAALCAAKGRPGDLPLTWHVASDEALERFPHVSALARRLAARYWPGPLTLVLPGVPPGLERAARDGWTGVRHPAQVATAGILAAMDFPVALSSANRHDGPPAYDADAVIATFGDDVELVVDGGPSRLREASAVLRVGPRHFDLLRPGLYTLDELRACAGLKLAFACTGNTCRSPMAEALARRAIAARLDVPPERLADFGFELSSMGVFAGVGAPASAHAVEVLGARGIDLSRHRSRPALPAEVERADRVFGLTQAHLDALRLSLPPSRATSLELLDPQGGDVPDPIGGSRDDYRECAERIEAAIEARLDEWA